jgi:uncharacterized phosphosugar-binding protein
MTANAVTASAYGDLVRDHLASVERHNTEALDHVADLLLSCVRADGLVLTAGAGHSIAAIAETFYRAGGLACVRPLYHPDVFPLHGAKRSTAAERRSGLADTVFQHLPANHNDVLVVFSTSGVNPYPVELAMAARKADISVVAVTSRPANAVAPARAASTVAANATIILDTLVPPGDAGYPADHPATAALSTMANSFLWNLVLARLFDKATSAAVDLPLWRSSNVPGGDDANATLFRRYAERIPELG